MIVKELPWDSDFFGFTVGSLAIPSTVNPDDVHEIIKGCACDVVYIQIEDPTPIQLECFSKLAPLIDHKIVYEKTISDLKLTPKEVIQQYDGEITDELVELAWASGLHSRFYLDPHFQPHYRRFYRTWLENSIAGNLADALFVPTVDDKQVGFVSIKAKDSIGQIGLIAVSSEHRRQGIAGSLIQNAQAWCQHTGLKRMRVVTQERNTAAGRLYEKHGYHIAKTVGIYHYWKV